MQPRIGSWPFIAGFALLASAPGTARADSADAAVAQELFDTGMRLVKQQQYGEACPKFEESQRLDPAPGTEFNLADCWEHVGRTASAWAAFVEVADLLKAKGETDREKLARSRADQLRPKLMRLAVSVAPEARISGLTVKRDGTAVREAQFGVGVPVDPGEHVVTASAPGSEIWEAKIVVSGEGQTTNVDVPKLGQSKGAAAPAAPAAPIASGSPDSPDRLSEASSGDTQRMIGLVLGGVGAVGLGVGGFFGLRSISKHKDYQSHCMDNVCDAEGVDLHDQAASAGTIATIAMGAGILALGGGGVLYFTAPDSKSARVGATPLVGTRGGGVSLTGVW